MEQIFCTLFDADYLDKGLVLYDSMVRHIKKFRLYVFAFDDRCYNILKSLQQENMIVIALSEFETEEILRVKGDRTKAEYCWTCTPWIIKYVIENYHEKICTYVDADMMFFSSPQPVFDRMKENGCSIIIVPHRFKNAEQERKAHDTVGSYCVEFNTFVDNVDGRRALDWWADRCLEWCYYALPGTTEWYGDQKYLNFFPDNFNGVYICEHIGVGLAPWNNMLVEYAGSNPLKVRDKKTGKVYPVILYHFENVSFLSKHILHVSSGLKSVELHKQIYDVYVSYIIEKRNSIRQNHNYSIPPKRRVVTRNIFMKIYQKYICPIRRIRKISDLYWVKEVSNGTK